MGERCRSKARPDDPAFPVRWQQGILAMIGCIDRRGKRVPPKFKIQYLQELDKRGEHGIREEFKPGLYIDHAPIHIYLNRMSMTANSPCFLEYSNVVVLM